MSLAFGWLARDPLRPASDCAAHMAAALRVHAAQRSSLFSAPGVAVGVLEPPARPGDDEPLEPAIGGGGRFTLWFAGEAFASGVAALGPRNAAESRTRAFRARLLERWLDAGIDGLSGLDGEYHLVIWDRDNRTITVVNDRFGGLPLYVGESPDGWAFAGGVRGVLAAPGIESTPDPEALREAVTFGGFRLDGRTNVATVRMVPGGTVQTFTSRGRAERRYWTFAQVAPADARDLPSAIDTLRSLWRTAIARRLEPTGRHGQTLSGGLDSRSILAEAAGQVPWTAVTYGLPNCDDARYARKAAEAMGSRWIFEPLYAGDWLSERTRHVEHTDGLMELGDLMHLESLPAQRDAMDVQLSGYIGDAVSGPTFGCVESLEDAVVAMPYFGAAVSLDFKEACARVDALVDRAAPVRFVIYENKLPQATNRVTAALRPWFRVRKPYVDYAMFDYCQGLPAAFRTSGRMHERWLRSTYPRCFASVPNQKTGLPTLAPAWRVTVARAMRRSASIAQRTFPAALHPRVRSYHDNDRVWRQPGTIERILEPIERRDALGAAILGRDRVRATVEAWRASAAAPSQVIGALYVYETYHRHVASHVGAAKRLPATAPAVPQGEL